MNISAVTIFYAVLAVSFAFLFLLALAFGLWMRKKHQKLKQDARLDPVSGMLSPLGFSELWAHSLRAQANTISVVSMQLPDLTELRTIYGIERYEQLLRQLAAVIAEHIAKNDPVVRTGEDSFFFVVRSYKREEISRMLDTLCRAMQKLMNSDSASIVLHPLFGVCFPDKSESAAYLMEKAAALRPFLSESQTIVYENPTSLSQREREQELVLALEPAIRNRELTVYYQPKIRLSDSQVVGMEALIRWRHPQKGILTPDMFLPALERYRVIPVLDRFVWDEVCALIARLKAEERELCPVSVNLSAVDLANPELSEQLYEVCCQHEVDPALIELECKERFLIADPKLAEEQVRRLREYGFRITIDNFGADQVSLALLGKLEPDIIKLDHGFFSGDNNSRQGRMLLDTLLKHAAQLHVSTVAAGVESNAQVQYLLQAACECAQGYYFMKPMPADRMIPSVYDGKTLRVISVEGSAEQTTGADTDSNFEQNQKTSQNIVLFTYWPEEDRAEFSDRFSPLLENGNAITRAASFFRASPLVYENDKEDFFTLLERSSKSPEWVENTLRFYGSAKRYEWMELRLKREVHAGTVRINGMLVNMAGWRNEINRWKERATRDAMTGVYNKSYFEQNVRKSLDNPNYQHASMVFFDMDYMKQLNDTYGHMFTDDVIRYLAKQIMGIFRHTDTIARFGGDEFMVFAPSMEPEILKERLNRLYQLFSYPYRSDNKEFHISVSIGAAFLGKDGSDYDTLLDHADCALYEAKERGRNQYVFYESYMLGDPTDAAVAPEYPDTEWN